MEILCLLPGRFRLGLHDGHLDSIKQVESKFNTKCLPVTRNKNLSNVAVITKYTPFYPSDYLSKFPEETVVVFAYSSKDKNKVRTTSKYFLEWKDDYTELYGWKEHAYIYITETKSFKYKGFLVNSTSDIEKVDNLPDIWDTDKIYSLNNLQHNEMFHPYTCPGDLDCQTRELVATSKGWICECGKYHQSWAL